jgi:uncharacterized membrane protein YtjA (UPF0391 family)
MGATEAALGRNMFKWMIGFFIIALVGAIVSFGYGIPAAGTVAFISFVLAVLLFAGRLFERTASA